MAKRYSIGRNPDNAFSYPAETTVSGTHAYLTLVSQNQLLIEDNRSTNGVHVNGQQVSTYLLQRGDNLRLGGLWLNVEELFREIGNREHPSERRSSQVTSNIQGVDVSVQFLQLKDVFNKYRAHLDEIDRLRQGTLADKIVRVSTLGLLTKLDTINVRKLDQDVRDWFKLNYVCPNCMMHLNDFPWEALARQKKCARCKAIWVK